MNRTCANCGEAFRCAPSRVKAGRGVYCSRECRGQGLSARYTGRTGLQRFGPDNPNWRGVRVARACPVCGDVFATANKTCSIACGHALQARSVTVVGNGNWKGAKTWLLRHYRDIVLKADSRCQDCGCGGELLVHHVNEDRTDNNLSNLRVLCSSCHQHTHRVTSTA